MISDEERREAAARLRAQADKLEARNPDGLYTAADLIFRLFDLVGATHITTLHDVFRFIADLIDRPTCVIRVSRADYGDGFEAECSRCGAGWVGLDDCETGWAYCPNCGAEVVHDD